MKTVTMERDFDYRPTKHLMRAYKGGKTYSRVPEAAVAAIVAAGAGRVVDEPKKRRRRDRSG